MPETGPWEDYQSTAVERGPWEDYKTAAPLAPVTINLPGEPAPPVMPAQPTAAPAPTRATDEERRTVLGFLGNAATSTGHLLGSMVNVPEQVAGTTALFAGMAEKSGFKKLPGLGDTNAVDALVSHYKDRYGSLEGFKKAVYEDPAAVMFDVAMVLEPGAAGLKAAGLPRAAAATTRVARAVNPVAQTIRAGEAALPYVVQGARAAPTAIRGAVPGAYKAAVAPRTAGEAALGYVVSQVAGPQAGATVSTALTGSRIARGAYRGAREALKARASAAAEALAAERATVITPEAPPAGPPVIPPERRLTAPPESIVTPPPEAPPDTSYVRGIPAEYPEVIPQSLRGKPAAEAAARELQTALQEPGARPATAQTAAHELATEQIAQALYDNGITAQDALTFDPSDWQNLTGSMMRGAADVPPSLTRDVTMRLKEIERAAAPSPAPSAPSAPPEPLKPQTVAQAQAEFKAAKKAAAPEEAGQALREEMGLGEEQLRPPPGEAKPAPTASETRVNRLSKSLAESELAMSEIEKMETTSQGRMILENYAVGKGLARPARGEGAQIVAKVRELREGAAPSAPSAAPGPKRPRKRKPQ